VRIEDDHPLGLPSFTGGTDEVVVRAGQSERRATSLAPCRFVPLAIGGRLDSNEGLPALGHDDRCARSRHLFHEAQAVSLEVTGPVGRMLGGDDHGHDYSHFELRANKARATAETPQKNLAAQHQTGLRPLENTGRHRPGLELKRVAVPLIDDELFLWEGETEGEEKRARLPA